MHEYGTYGYHHGSSKAFDTREQAIAHAISEVEKRYHFTHMRVVKREGEQLITVAIVKTFFVKGRKLVDVMVYTR